MLTVKNYFIGPCTYTLEGAEAPETVLSGRICLELSWSFGLYQKVHHLNISHDEAADPEQLRSILSALDANLQALTVAPPNLAHLADFTLNNDEQTPREML